jgi:hypothetical protein
MDTACEFESSSRTFLFVTFDNIFFPLLFRFSETGVSYPLSFLVAGGGSCVNPTFLLVCAWVHCAGECVDAGVNTNAAGRLEGALKVE